MIVGFVQLTGGPDAEQVFNFTEGLKLQEVVEMTEKVGTGQYEIYWSPVAGTDEPHWGLVFEMKHLQSLAVLTDYHERQPEVGPLLQVGLLALQETLHKATGERFDELLALLGWMTLDLAKDDDAAVTVVE